MQRSGAPAEATSQYFVAHLGEPTPEVEARLVQWGACCVEHRLVRDGKKCLLYFARAESRSVRQMQSLLRTLSARWKLPLGKLESGWCQLLTEAEFRDCVPATPTRMTPCHAVWRRRAAATSRCHAWILAAGCCCVFLRDSTSAVTSFWEPCARSVRADVPQQCLKAYEKSLFTIL